jgi:two-component system NarL family response regulator
MKMEKERITIMVVDDHAIVRDGLEALLNTIAGFSVIAKASGGKEAIELYGKFVPDITLMDIKLPDLDGISASKKILVENPGAKIIVLTTYMGEEDIYRAFAAGARGYILKDTPVGDLENVIRKVNKGEKNITPEIAAILAERVGSSFLTPRETEILYCMAKGLSNDEICKRLFISLSTVKTHITNILNKLQVKSRSEAVAKAIEKGIIHP